MPPRTDEYPEGYSTDLCTGCLMYLSFVRVRWFYSAFYVLFFTPQGFLCFLVFMGFMVFLFKLPPPHHHHRRMDFLVRVPLALFPHQMLHSTARRRIPAIRRASCENIH